MNSTSFNCPKLFKYFKFTRITFQISQSTLRSFGACFFFLDDPFFYCLVIANVSGSIDIPDISFQYLVSWI